MIECTTQYRASNQHKKARNVTRGRYRMCWAAERAQLCWTADLVGPAMHEQVHSAVDSTAHHSTAKHHNSVCLQWCNKHEHLVLATMTTEQFAIQKIVIMWQCLL